MKLDIHTHIMPEKMPNWTQKFGYGEFIHLEHRNCEACMMKGDKVFRVVTENCFKEDVRLKEMDETEVTMQVLSTIPVLFNYWANPADGLETSRFFNDHIAETVSKESKRFIGIRFHYFFLVSCFVFTCLLVSFLKEHDRDDHRERQSLLRPADPLACLAARANRTPLRSSPPATPRHGFSMQHDRQVVRSVALGNSCPRCVPPQEVRKAAPQPHWRVRASDR